MKTDTTEYSLYDSEIRDNFKDAAFYLMLCNFAGAMGYWLCEYKHRSRINVDKPLDAFCKVVQDKYFPTEDTVIIISFNDLHNFITEEMLYSIPELRELNELDSPYFYDLGALARNVFYTICREAITQPL